MKTIWVNLISIIRKFKFATFLNISGFSVSFAAFIIIMMQLHFEYSFEDYHPNTPRIYRAERVYKDGSAIILSRPFIDEVIKSSPHIVAGTIITPYNGDYYFTVEDDPERTSFVEPIMRCYPDITEIFNFKMTQGDARSLAKLGNALIPASLAEKLFGKENAVGKHLIPLYEDMMEGSDTKLLEIGGVYKDFPGNTQLKNAIYTDMRDEGKDNWINNNYMVYVLLNDEKNQNEVTDNFNRTFDFENASSYTDKDFTLGLMPLKNIYFENRWNAETVQKTGNKDTSRLLLLIAFLIIVIATINYVNFSTSIAPMRIKSINTQKVLGASDRLLKRTLLSETMLICMLSFCVSLLVVYIFNKTDYISFVDTDLNFSSHLPVVFMTGTIALAIGLIAGIYPAYYMMKFPPALVLKGSFGLSPNGKRLRTGLVGVQFMISFILIISALFIYAQNKYMKNFDIGFKPTR